MAAARRFSEVSTVRDRFEDTPTLQVLTLGPLRVIVKGREATTLRWRTTKPETCWRIWPTELNRQARANPGSSLAGVKEKRHQPRFTAPCIA